MQKETEDLKFFDSSSLFYKDVTLTASINGLTSEDLKGLGLKAGDIVRDSCGRIYAVQAIPDVVIPDTDDEIVVVENEEPPLTETTSYEFEEYKALLDGVPGLFPFGFIVFDFGGSPLRTFSDREIFGGFALLDEDTDDPEPILPVNGRPIARSDSFFISENTTGTSIVDNVLDGDGNDFDPDGDMLTVSSVSLGLPPFSLVGSGALTAFDISIVELGTADPDFVPGSVATFKITIDGKMAFVFINPNGDQGLINNDDAFNGLSGDQDLTFNFTYTNTDGDLISDPVDFMFTVGGENDAPVAIGDQFLVNENIMGNVIVGNLITGPGMDTDPDGDTLLIEDVTLAMNPISLVGIGGLNVGDISIVELGNMDAGYVAGSVATFKITIDGKMAFIYVNPNGDQGLINTDDAFGGLSKDQVLTFNFIYTNTDGELVSDPAAITLPIKGKNDAPKAVDDIIFTTEDVAGNVILKNLITGDGTDSDPDGDSLSINDVSLGAVPFTLSGIGGLNVGDISVVELGNMDAGYVAGSVATFKITIDGKMAFIYVNPNGDQGLINTDDAFGGLSKDQVLTFNLVYTNTDGELVSDPADITLSIKGKNDPPKAEDDIVFTNENVMGNMILENLITGPGADTDPDGDLLSINDVSLGPVPVTLTGIGGLTVGDISILEIGALDPDYVAGSVATFKLTIDGKMAFIYVNPNGDQGIINTDNAFNGLSKNQVLTLGLVYTNTDGIAISNPADATIILKGLNDAPIAVDDMFTVDKDVVGDVIIGNKLTGPGTDSDPDGDAIVIADVDLAYHAITLTGYGGLSLGDISIIELNANDPDFVSGSVATFMITVYDYQDCYYTLSEAFIYVLPNGEEHLINNENAFEPLGIYQTLAFNFTYTNTDGELLSNVAEQTVTIVPVNLPPVVTVDPDVLVLEGEAASVVINSPVDKDDLLMEFDSIGNFPMYPNLNGVGLIQLVADHPVSVTFEEERAGFNNTLGWYVVDEFGTITNVHLLFEKSDDLLRGDSVFLDPDNLNLPEGTQIGFFVVADGGDRNDFDSFVDGNFQFLNDLGDPATIFDDSPVLWFVPDVGAPTKVDSRYGDNGVWHSAAKDNNIDLNFDGEQHTFSRVAEDGTILMSFEDLKYLGDNDYDDFQFFVDVGTPTTDALLQLTDVTVDDPEDDLIASATLTLIQEIDPSNSLDFLESLDLHPALTISGQGTDSITVSGLATEDVYSDVLDFFTINLTETNGVVDAGELIVEITATDEHGDISAPEIFTLQINEIETPDYHYC